MCEHLQKLGDVLHGYRCLQCGPDQKLVKKILEDLGLDLGEVDKTVARIRLEKFRCLEERDLLESMTHFATMGEAGQCYPPEWLVEGVCRLLARPGHAMAMGAG